MIKAATIAVSENVSVHVKKGKYNGSDKRKKNPWCRRRLQVVLNMLRKEILCKTDKKTRS